MKKITFFFSIFLIFACEDKDDEVNPLVGQWNMTNFSSGTYIRVNKTQEIFMGETEGSIQAKAISNGILTDTYNLTEVDILSFDDGTFINVSEYGDNFYADYIIEDYIGSLSSYAQSTFSVSSENIMGNYFGTNFDYLISTNSLKIFPDTLYRKLYINGNEVWDSTRYAIVEGSIKQLGTMVESGKNFLMESNIFGPMEFPDELTFILDDDGTGRIIEKMWGQTEEIEIKWEATDSTLSWNECFDGECDSEVVNFTFEISSTGLLLSNYQDMCQFLEEMAGEGTCDLMMNDEFGVEMGTLEAFWMEMNVSLSSTQVSKKAVNKIYHNKRSKWGNYSFINGYKPPKKFNR